MADSENMEKNAAGGLPDRPLFTEYIHHRMNGREAHSPAMTKLEVAEFARQLGFRTAGISKVFDRADEITEDKLPDRCVVKPTRWWATRGVMLLQKNIAAGQAAGKSIYREMLTGRDVDVAGIVAEQAQHQSDRLKLDAASDPKIILEEFVVDEAGPRIIPFDYKMYCFNGEVRFIVQVNRNVKPPLVAFYRDDFTPMKFENFMEPNLNWCRLGQHRIPKCWYELLQLGRKISSAMSTPFISVDAYASESGPVVGELTPTPGGPYFGMWRFQPFFDQQLGDAWTRARTVLHQQARHFVPPSRASEPAKR